MHRFSRPTEFRIIQGTYKDLFVRYAGNGHWFMKIDIPEDAQFVDGAGVPLSVGDTLQVTMQIHPTLFYVQFGPHGSEFLGDAARLTYNLRYADLSGRDISDATVWYQPTEGADWSAEATKVDARRNNVSIHLRHFSNYAVAW